MVLQPRHEVGAQRIDVDAVKRVEPHEQIVLDRRRAARPRRPVPQRRSALGREGIDQLVWLTRLHDLAALSVAPVAEPCELAVDLLVVRLPEEPDRRVEYLCEFIARHRTFRQADQDCVTERHYADLRPQIARAIYVLTICIKFHMRQYAYTRGFVGSHG